MYLVSKLGGLVQSTISRGLLLHSDYKAAYLTYQCGLSSVTKAAKSTAQLINLPDTQHAMSQSLGWPAVSWSKTVIFGLFNRHCIIALTLGKRMAICNYVDQLQKLSAASGRPCRSSIGLFSWPAIIVDLSWVSNTTYMP